MELTSIFDLELVAHIYSEDYREEPETPEKKNDTIQHKHRCSAHNGWYDNIKSAILNPKDIGIILIGVGIPH